MTEGTPIHTDHAAPDAGGPPGRLERLLERQLGLYGELDALSQMQSDLIESDDPDRLLEVLGRREALVEAILGLNAEMEPLVARWEREGDSSDDVRARLAAVQSVARTVAERDERDRAALQRRRDTVADQLASIGRGRGAVKAYGPPGGARGSAAPRFQDREG